MTQRDNLELRSINGLSPEKAAALQKAAEQRVCKKNRQEHILYVLFGVALIALIPSTALEYVLAGVISIGGGVTLWYSQNAPFGPDSGMPRTQGIPPIFALLLLLVRIITAVAVCVLLYTIIW